ncbi:MAG: protein kinase domain-containing protein [Gemmataceae bacterium]
MSRRFACPRGHIWYAEPPPAGAGDSTRVLPTCPSCGEAGDLYPARVGGSDSHGGSTSRIDSDALVIEDDSSVPHVDPGVPPTLPGYEIRSEIGRGGMGVVYDAWDTQHRGQVAIKYLPRLDPSKILRFKREFRALADLSHSNLAGIYELAQVDGRWFIVMERIEGESFVDHFLSVRDVVERTRLLRPALIQLVEGIHHLHQAGLLHCDIKPSNVLITANGRVVLLDFGLVTDWVPPDASDAHAELVGSLGYLAPERFAGKPPSAAGDWYAVGVMLYEVLGGKRPFHGSRTKLIWQQRYMDPPPPAELNPAVPAEWNALCVALVSRDPAKRPDAAELLKRLRAPANAAPTVWRGREVPLVGRDRQLAALRDAFDASRAGATTVARLRGASGMGKTTLVECFLDRLAAREPVTVLRGRCHRQESVPFKGVDGLIDALSHHLAGQPQAELKPLLPADMGALCRVFPVLRRIKLGPAGWKAVEGLDPLEIRRRCFLALRELLAHLAGRKPLVLVLDDLHWGDADSARLLAEFLRPPDAPPLLLIASWRTEEESTSDCLRLLDEAFATPPAPRVVDVGLEPLTLLESESLAAALLADGDFHDELPAAIAREAEGRPLYVHELARHFRAAPESKDAPELLGLIGERVRRLPATARRVLELLAVAAQPLRSADAQHSADMDTEPRATWSMLRSRHFVREFNRADEPFVECYHDSVREAVLNLLSPAETAAVHDRLSRTFAAHHARDHVLLAVHCLGAGRAEEAAEHYAHAAAEAAEALAFERAAQLYRLSLELHPRPPAESSALRQKLADCLANAGHGPEAAEAYLAACRGADRSHIRRLRRLAAYHYCVSGHMDEGLQTLRELCGDAGLDFPDDAGGSRWQGLLKGRGRWRGLKYRVRDIEELSTDELERVDLCWTATAGLALYDWPAGAYFQALHLRHALDAGEPTRLVRALAWEAARLALEGKTAARAARCLDAARELATKSDRPHAAAMVALAEGISHFSAGDWDKAADALTRAGDLFRSRCPGSAWELDAAQLFLSLTLHRRGDDVGLRELAGRMVKDARERGDRFAATNAAIFAAPLARVAAGDSAAALQIIADALADWPAATFSLQHALALYSAAKAGDRTMLERDRAKLQSSALWRLPALRGMIEDVG